MSSNCVCARSPKCPWCCADIVTPFRPNITHTTMALSPRDLTHFLPSRVANGNEIAAPLTSDLRYTQDFRSDPTSLLDVTTSTTTNVTAAPEGCPWSFAWCGQVPQVRLQQFLGGTVAIAIGYPVCNVMTYTLFSKVLGPQPQVSPQLASPRMITSTSFPVVNVLPIISFVSSLFKHVLSELLVSFS